MATERIQRATTSDGVEIAGRVHGEGPPLVLVHGVTDDGDVCWESILPFLKDDFTCYLMSNRGRGLSGDGPDHTRDGRIRDVTAFAESIGEPVALMGLSSGALVSLGAAARSDVFTRVAAYEPALVHEAANQDELAQVQQAMGSIIEAIEEGRAADAIGIFVELVSTEDEMTEMRERDYMTAAAPVAPALLEDLKQMSDSGSASPSSPEILADVTVPVQVLRGSESALQWFEDGARHVERHLPDATMKEVPGAGHCGPLLRPEAVAIEVIGFLGAA
ncbi:MAG: alpha/beta fold hydrolase [Actinomycetota bacterium]